MLPTIAKVEKPFFLKLNSYNSHIKLFSVNPSVCMSNRVWMSTEIKFYKKWFVLDQKKVKLLR